jgi:hypothetical protein
METRTIKQAFLSIVKTTFKAFYSVLILVISLVLGFLAPIVIWSTIADLPGTETAHIVALVALFTIGLMISSVLFYLMLDPLTD